VKVGWNSNDGFNINSGPYNVYMEDLVSVYNAASGLTNTGSNSVLNRALFVGNLGTALDSIWIADNFTLTNATIRGNFIGLNAGGSVTVKDSCICGNSYLNVQCSTYQNSSHIETSNTQATAQSDCTAGLYGTFSACPTTQCSSTLTIPTDPAPGSTTGVLTGAVSTSSGASSATSVTSVTSVTGQTSSDNTSSGEISQKISAVIAFSAVALLAVVF